MAEQRCIVTFPSTHMALRAERLARHAGIPVQMIPAPRRLSADCNMAMETSPENRDVLHELLIAEHVDCHLTAYPDL